MLNHQEFKKLILKLCLAIYCLCTFGITKAQNAPADLYYDIFPVSVYFKDVGSKSFEAIYIDDKNVLLPVYDVLKYIKFYTNTTVDQNLISGFLESEENPFSIDLKQKRIVFKDHITTLNATDAIMDMGILFVKTQILSKAFDFKIDFNFRSLSADFSASYELPQAKILRLEKAREKLQVKTGTFEYDTILQRRYHLFQPGMIDWSVASTQSQKYNSETRLNFGAGAEVLGGETDVWLNYSDRYGFYRNQQRYFWRWVDNEAKIVRQVKLGRINSPSIATLLSPVDGFSITNTPTTLRKTVGDYQIIDYTEPEWLVELYVNGTLIEYTKADASGYYMFTIPIFYGTNTIKLRFYGPDGQERSEEKIINMPYTFLPKGEMEYRITGGQLLEGGAKFARARASYGIAYWMSAKTGIEYMSKLHNNTYIPFIGFDLQPMPKLVLSAEYAHGVKTHATLNYSFPKNIHAGIDYTYYSKEQDAIIYNYKEERKVSVSVPLKYKKVSGFARANMKQNVYQNFTYNSNEILLSGYYKRYNVNLNTLSNWTNSYGTNTYSNLSASYRTKNGLTLRPSCQYNYNDSKFISYKVEAEKQFLTNGRFTAGYENNIRSNYQSINVSLRYNFSFMMAAASAFFNKDFITTSQSARGGFAFASGKNKALATNRTTVGRSGLSIIPFIDVNCNGIYEMNEATAPSLRVNINGGKVHYNKKDDIIRVTGLEPFIYYNLTIDESKFENIAWQVDSKQIQVLTDPNQFKKIYISVKPVGEVSGMILGKNNKGFGRILVNIYNTEDKLVKQTISEFDGYWTHLGLIPGKYYMTVDSTQLSRLNLTADTIPFKIDRDPLGDIVDIGNLHVESPVIEQPIEISAIKEPAEKLFATIDSIKTKTFYINFGFDKWNIEPQYESSLKYLADIINEHPSIKLLIEAHTDSDGPAAYNQKLSERRAKSIYTFLLKSKVPAHKISSIGYGETRPLNSNATKAEKAANRRVMFTNTSDTSDIDISKLLNNLNKQNRQK